MTRIGAATAGLLALLLLHREGVQAAPPSAPSTVPNRSSTMSSLQPGAAVPSFTLLDDEGKAFDPAALTDKPIVIFFYPKDDTPGCTIECKEFRDARAAFLEKAHVYGISPDDAASHKAFREKYALNFPLLSDPGHKVAEKFGVWGLKPNGKEGIFRTTFILKGGKVAKVFENVKPEGHAAEVLAAL